MNSSKHDTLDRAQIIHILTSAKDGDRFPLLVTGASMVPFLFNTRSLVYLEKNSAYVPKRGDIVFFARPVMALVLLRVVQVREDGSLLINGDAQSWTEVITPEQILAHVTHIQRRVRVFSVENRFYRLMVKLWMPLRAAHPVLCMPFFYANCVIFKLSRRYRETYSR